MPAVRDRIGRALDLLTEQMSPFVERELRSVYGEAWPEAARSSFRDERPGTGGSLEWDAHLLLTVMWDQWNAVFRRTLSPMERSLVVELRDFRNRWAHQAPLTLDDSFRVLDSIQRLFRAAGVTGADEIEREKIDVLRDRFAREANTALSRREDARRRNIDVAVYVVCCAAILGTLFAFFRSDALIPALFVLLVFAFFVYQRLSVRVPFYGVHECPKCHKVVYTEVCPYCAAGPV